MKEVVLEVKERAEKGTRESRRMRTAGTIPAILYGAKQSPISLGIAVKEFNRVIHGGAGENVVLTLNFSGDKKEGKTAIIKEIQRDPVSRNIVHIDLLAISLKDKIKVNVPVMVTGDAPGIKEGGILEYVLREVEVECLPTQIPEHIMVDVSSLKINESIHVRDLKLADDQVKVLTPADRMLISIVPPTVLEEPTPVEGAIAPEAAEPVAPEVIKKGKKEEEPEAGTAAPAKDAKEEKK
jgi:large subunit ribosomal protein L25